MQSLVTWCGGLSVHVFPPDSYIAILTSTVMGWGGPLGGNGRPEGALSTLPALPGWLGDTRSPPGVREDLTRR